MPESQLAVRVGVSLPPSRPRVEIAKFHPQYGSLQGVEARIEADQSWKYFFLSRARAAPQPLGQRGIVGRSPCRRRRSRRGSCSGRS